MQREFLEWDYLSLCWVCPSQCIDATLCQENWISLNYLDFLILPQQTVDSLVETDRKPISKRCNDVRIDSNCRVLLQSRFTRHTFPEIWVYMKFGCTKYNGNVMAHLPFKLCVPILMKISITIHRDKI